MAPIQFPLKVTFSTTLQCVIALMHVVEEDENGPRHRTCASKVKGPSFWKELKTITTLL
ncbi:transcriptional regulator [Sesbania bispinosa]|nr:transcriptional regulator [Sesbania bispinosa]